MTLLQPIIEIIPSDPAPEVKAGIDAALTQYNAEMRNFAPDEPDFAIALRHPETNAVLGGLHGVDDFGWTFVKLLVVPKEFRGMGIGAQILREAEAIARSRRHIGIWLNTFEFQARPFYEKQGYALFGQLEGENGAVAQYFLKKRF